MLAEQKKLEDQYVALVADQAQLRNLPNKNKLIENQKAVYAVTEQIRQGTQALVRNLKVCVLTCSIAADAAIWNITSAAILSLTAAMWQHSLRSFCQLMCSL